MKSIFKKKVSSRGLTSEAVCSLNSSSACMHTHAHLCIWICTPPTPLKNEDYYELEVSLCSVMNNKLAWATEQERVTRKQNQANK